MIFSENNGTTLGRSQLLRESGEIELAKHVLESFGFDPILLRFGFCQLLLRFVFGSVASREQDNIQSLQKFKFFNSLLPQTCGQDVQ